jgi:hydrogenase nickel incorporation protein HypA/HybF
VHELSIAGAVLDTAVKHAGGRRVTAVAVRAGALRQVVPSSLVFYWEIVTRDTPLEGARLDVAEVPARLRCAACGHEWEPGWPDFRCPSCGSGETELRSGEELEVESIEVEEGEPACIGRG